MSLSLTAILAMVFGELPEFHFSLISTAIFCFIPLAFIRQILSSNINLLYLLAAIGIALVFFQNFQSSTIKTKLLNLTFVCFIIIQGLFTPTWSSDNHMYLKTIEGRHPSNGKTISFTPAKDIFIAAFDWMNLTNEIDPNRKLYIWYDATEPFGQIFRNYNALTYFWQEQLINERFPAVKVPPTDWHGPVQHKPMPGMEILISTNYKEQRMSELLKNLAEAQLKYEILKEIPFERDPLSWSVIKLKILPL
jgi:hypothetical protein